MCELLVMAASHETSDPMRDPQVFKAGDALIARADGWNWGGEEVANPMFIIFRVPDMTQAQGQALCAEEPGDMMTTPTLLIRQFKIDFSLLPPELAALIDGETRQRVYFELSASQVTAAVVTKPPADNPMVIG